MANRKSKKGEQLELIDVTPEELKDLAPVVEKYRDVVTERAKLSKKETALKVKILTAVKSADLQRLRDGTIRFRLDHMIVSVTPRDELVRVTEENLGEWARQLKERGCEDVYETYVEME